MVFWAGVYLLVRCGRFVLKTREMKPNGGIMENFFVVNRQTCLRGC